jgi:hypothetical protein
VRNTPTKFITPFKAGMRPGEKGRVALDGMVREVSTPILGPTRHSGAALVSTMRSGKGKERWKVFDLSEFLRGLDAVF